MAPVVLVALVILAVWSFGRVRRYRPWRLVIATVIAMLALWPAFAYYFGHYRVRLETIVTLAPRPDKDVELASNAAVETSERGINYCGDSLKSYIQWTGLRLPPGRRYFLEVEMWASGGNLSRVSWAGADGIFHPSQFTDFQGVVKYTKLVPWYESAPHRYFVMIGDCDYPLTGVRLAPSNVKAFAGIRSARVVALAE